MRILHFAGLWAGVEEVPLEQVFARLGIGAKLSIFFAYVLSGGAISSVLFEASAWQATVGKRLLNIYVTDNNGQRITLARSFDRWFVKWFAGFFGGSLVSIITILTTEDHRALHDLAVGTVVLRGRPSLAGKLELWRVLAAFIIPFAWMIGTFLATL